MSGGDFSDAGPGSFGSGWLSFRWDKRPAISIAKVAADAAVHSVAARLGKLPFETRIGVGGGNHDYFD